VCLHLGLEGYACEGAGDGQEALKRAEAERFDLLVLDVNAGRSTACRLCAPCAAGA
jgi:DNA-binding response OmpR family regulator